MCHCVRKLSGPGAVHTCWLCAQHARSMLRATQTAIGRRLPTLAHDTASNKICPKGADCPRVHLDTKTSQKDAKAYKEAQDIVHRVKKKMKKGPI